MDLSVFEVAQQGVILEIVHPVTGEPMVLDDGTRVTVTLVGRDSDEWKARERVFMDKRLAQRSPKPVKSADIEDEALQAIAGCIKGWSGMKFGERIYQHPKDVLELLRTFPHLRRQIDEFVGNAANFLKVSAKN